MKPKSATRKGVEPQGAVAPDELTPKQHRFVDEYLVDLNGKQAAIRAGYSPHTAEGQASRLLSKAKVHAQVELKRKELAGELGISRQRVLREMAKIAFSDPRDLFNQHGHLIPIHELSDSAAGAIASIEVDTIKIGEGKVTVTTKVKCWDKGKQLENLLKHLGMDGDKPVVPEIGNSAIDLLAAKISKFKLVPVAA